MSRETFANVPFKLFFDIIFENVVHSNFS